MQVFLINFPRGSCLDDEGGEDEGEGVYADYRVSAFRYEWLFPLVRNSEMNIRD
jgi:hypothetical protein